MDNANKPHELSRVMPSLLRSGFLTLHGYLQLSTLLRLPWSMEEGLACTQPPALGPGRFRLWQRLLTIDPATSSSVPPFHPSKCYTPAHRAPPHQPPTPLLSPTPSHTPPPPPAPPSSQASLAYYLRLAEADSQATQLSTGQRGEIVRDTVRTFPAHRFFAAGAGGERMLGRILQALLLACPETGYCQGMNFVAGAWARV